MSVSDFLTNFMGSMLLLSRKVLGLERWEQLWDTVMGEPGGDPMDPSSSKDLENSVYFYTLHFPYR
ncbi:hypothetical protein DV515_00017043 [Chloebia gouldiae]|uniref:Uncharacterized protein n=1 Tax=Chloebia gouldiae TaxID=44316 RepID=A0A3L8R9M2_CHLGU|nr:hypothetical protein DV515_00017043 [Chloebia gouldiae]